MVHACLKLLCAKVQLKPEVYTTINDKIIVEDGFLYFFSMKLRALSQDDIVLLATNIFDSEWIEMSKKRLSELCTTMQCNISYRN